MTTSELKRWLKKHGCTFVEGTKHTIVFLGHRRTTIPRHPSKELNPKTVHSILKDLGITKDQ